MIFPVGVIFSMVLLAAAYVKGSDNLNMFYRACFFILLCAACISIGVSLHSSMNKAYGMKVAFSVAACILFVVETGFSVKCQMNNYHTEDVSDYKEYVKDTSSLIQEIQEQDEGIYRLSQTSTRNQNEDGITAYYNEAMAYQYWSLSGYSSSPDAVVSSFLNNVGYRENDIDMCVVNTSILGADSLMGVKYVLSGFPINGLKQIESEGEHKKAVFENPYVLPMAFTYHTAETMAFDEDNPFIYQNQLFRYLSGIDSDIYAPLEYQVSDENDGNLHYIVNSPEGNCSVYGNLPWDSAYDGEVNVNDVYKISYARWLSPSVFYIPTEQNEESFKIEVQADDALVSNGREQFYALNLDMLDDITTSMKEENTVSDMQIQNGYARIEAYGTGDNCLFVSIPYDECWTITCNGEKITPQLAAECFYSIPLQDGDNTIEMTYRTKHLPLGIGCTVIGIIALAMERVFRRYHSKANDKNRI